ncbi:AAA family ATPase [Lacticaseibacillus daqingensis]|uniref:AAA family ATPase n=1 Tax=Lacticaseibacillus daqingensis TaxID=2486014 RepID=UPI0013DDD983|nr:SMC family ATPase [Lacticaseibacillus daqingensis]
MQLLRLDLQNFGPYRDATVDFTAFAETPLFLISGKTGSGKTTIFDALVFALYGTTTGDDRSGREMRASFAAPSEPTRVTLTFAHGGKQYVIWREPDQVLAKKRGGGTTSVPMHVSLSEQVEGREVNEWTKVRDVAPRIEGLLHLDADQFRQMILLPQGKFRQFLDAKSDDKEALLRHLFGTALFKRWQDNLRAIARQKQAAVKKQAERLDTLAGQFAFDGATPDASVPMPDRLAVMHDRLTALEATVTAAAAELTAAAAAYAQAEAAAQAGDRLHQAFADRASAAAALAELAATAPARAAQQAQLTQLQWVQQHVAVADQLTTQEQALASLAKRVTTATQALTAATAAATAAEETQARLAAAAPAHDEAVKRRDRLQGLRPQLEQVAELTAALEAANQAVTTTAAKVAAATAAEAKGQAAQTANAAAQAAVADHAEEAAAATAKLAALTPRFEQWQAGARERSQLTRQQTTAAAALATATAAAETAQTHYATLRDARLSQQIAVLAAQLSPGAACPVCGSETHPHPAVASNAAPAVSDTALEAADAARQEAQITLAQAQATAERLAAQAQTLTASQIALTTQLTGAADGDVAAVMAVAKQAADHLTELVAQEQAARTRLMTAATALATTQQKLAQAVTDATAAAHAATVTQASLAGQQAAAQKALPPDAPALEVLAAEIQQLTAEDDAYRKAVDEARVALTAAQADAVQARTQLADLTAQQQTATAQHQTAQAAFVAALTAQFGTPDTARFDALRAQLDQQAELSAALTAAKTQQDQQTALLDRANAAIGTQEAPDLAALAAAKAAAAAAQATAQTAHANATHELATNRKLVTTIETEYAANQTAMDEAVGLESLFQVVTGNNPAKLSLERYVLRAYLQRVLEVSNTRLKTLSAGRYIFTLHQEPGSHRNDSGLEIDIYDDQIGATRSVHTLSGGESFIAALALALALGEVIQQESGGVSIDALFVDEGFGSLDSASLTIAMTALESLEGQSRMIGIISHVTELREGIPDQLQVIADGNGESHLQAVHRD